MNSSINWLAKLCTLFIFASSMTAMAEEKTSQKCMDSELVKYALSLYKIQDLTDEVVTKEYTEQDACDQDVFKQVLEGLDYLRKTPNKKIPAGYTTLVSKEGPAEFLKKRIKTIQLRKSENFDAQCTSPGGFVRDDEIDSHIMHICPNIKNGLTISTAALLVHEARHIDGFKHVACKHGLYFKWAGGEACDNTYQEQGSYGIGQGYNFINFFGSKNEGTKQYARALIVIDSLGHFNKAPFSLAKGGILLSDKNVLSFYDGEKEEHFAEFNDETVALAPIFEIPRIYFKNGSVTKYNFSRKWQLQDDSSAKAYKKLSDSERESLLDVVTAKETCYLLPDLIKCIDRDGSLTSMSLGSLNATRFFSEYTLNEYKLRVYTGAGEIYYLPGSILFKEYTVDKGFITKDFHYPEVTSYAEMESGKLIGITPQGFLVEKKTKDAPWTRTKRFGDATFKKIVPFYWSKRLEDL